MKLRATSEQQRANRRWRISVGFMVFASIVMAAGLVKIADTQSDIKVQAHHSDAYTCAKFNQLRGGMARVIKFSTKPADLTNLAPERVPIVAALNQQRAEFRAAAIGRLPGRCRP